MRWFFRIFTYPIRLWGILRCIVNWAKWAVVLAKSPPEVLLAGNPHLNAARRPARRKPRHPAAYVMSSLLLHRCYEDLTVGPCEDLNLVAGMPVDGRFVLTEMVKPANVDRRMTRAVARPLETRDALLVIDKFGLRAAGLFHSHPGQGAGAATPSSVDWANQRVWEQAYPLVGAVFTRDGYVRFFATRSIRVDVYGAKVRKVDDNLFKIEID